MIFFDDQDNKKDVKIKSNTEMDGIEAIPYASLKRENDIDDKEPKLETAAEIEKQTAEREKKIIKSELKQDKVDMQVSRESDIKEVQDVFGEVKEEEPLNVEISLLVTMIFSTVKGLLMQIGSLLLILLTDQILLPILKNSLKNQMRQKWKFFILKKKN